jgi:hypothetical protein
MGTGRWKGSILVAEGLVGRAAADAVAVSVDVDVNIAVVVAFVVAAALQAFKQTMVLCKEQKWASATGKRATSPQAGARAFRRDKGLGDVSARGGTSCAAKRCEVAKGGGPGRQGKGRIETSYRARADNEGK